MFSIDSRQIVLLSFVVISLLVVIISFFASRKSNRSTGSGYFLAGRSLSGIVIATSLIMTDLSAVQLIGNNGQAVNVGISVLASQGLALSGMILSGLFFIPKYLNSGINAFPELITLRYDKFTSYLVMGLMIIQYTIVMIPTAIYTGAQILISAFELDKLLDLSYFQTLVLICAIVSLVGMLYTVLGGLETIAVSDTIYGAGMLIGGVMVTFFGFTFLSRALGGDGQFMDGISKFLHTDPAMLNAWNEPTSNEPWWPWPVLFTGMVVMNTEYNGCDQAMIQRAFGAKSMAHAQKGMLYAGILSLLTPIFLVIPGIIAKLAFPAVDFTANGDSAFPMLITQCLPKPLLGFLAACIMGAVLSTYDGMLNSASTIFSLNIYKDGINKDATDEHVVKVGKRFGKIVAVGACIISPFFCYCEGITSWVVTAIGVFCVPILILAIMALYSKRTPKNIAKVIIPFHIIVYIAFCYIFPHFIPFFAKVHYMYWLFALFIVEMFIVWIMTRLNPLEEDFVLPHNPPEGMDMTPWKWRKQFIVLTLACTALIYIIFSPLGVGKSDTTTWERHMQAIEQQDK